MWQQCNVAIENKIGDKGAETLEIVGASGSANALEANSSGIQTFEVTKFTGVQIFVYGLSLIVTFVALYLAVSGGDVINPASRWIFGLLFFNFAIILYFAIGLVQQISKLLKQGKEAKTGARLHIYYVRLFIFAAALPAILIAVFSAFTIGRGVQTWLSGQVASAIEATSSFGKETIQQTSDSARVDILAMASDLNAAAAQYNASPAVYRSYLTSQTGRRGFVAAYLYNSDGTIIEKVERPTGAPAQLKPMPEDFATARAGDVYVNIDHDLIVRTLFKLNAYQDIYLQAVRLPKPEQLRLVQQAEQIVGAYRLLETRQTQLQVVFGLAYLETVLLVAIGAGWLGLASATNISMPIARLASAAERVRAGDLSVQVSPDYKLEELTTLILTFNRMTSDIQNQRDAIEKSRIQAETRSAFIQALFEGVSAGIISLDQDYKIMAANSAAARLLDVATPELFAKGLFEIAPEFRPIIVDAKRNLGVQGHVERESGNRTLIFDIRATYAGNDLVVTFDDISSQIAAQRQAAWKDVARRIAHEIKNPLTPIQLSAERLASKFSKEITTDRETFVKMTDTIVRQVADIGRMVDEFSDFARMPAPKFELADIGEIIRQAVFAQKITYSEIEYSVHTPPEEILISMDARLMVQALSNILKNAAESIAQAEVGAATRATSHKIEVSLNLEGKEARIEIDDTGVGFPVKDRNRLLEPYMTTRAKGTGLGLAIVARVMEEHGGSLTLADRKDGQAGGSVIMILPIGEYNPNKSLQGVAK